jgi:hypothetical protein
MPDFKPEPSQNATDARPMHRFGIGVNVLIQITLFVALFGIVNYLSYRHYWRRDLSPSRDYTLSDASLNYIHKLGKDVDITIVFTRESDVMPDVRALVEEYRRAKEKRIHVEEIDPARDIERAEQLKLNHKITLSGNGILVTANKRTRFISEQEIIVKGAEGNRANPSVDFRGEDAITSAIVGLIEGEVKKFYFVIGKGSASGKEADPAFIALSELGLQQNFEVVTLDLNELEKIPDDANGLVLIGPKYDLNEREMGVLTTYWQGKRAAIFLLLDPNGTTPRLKKFLQSNGVIPRPDRVLYAESTSSGPKKQFSVQTEFLDDSPISKSLRNVSSSLSGQTQSLDLRPESPEVKQQHIEIIPLIQANEKFWGETDYLAELPKVDPEDTKPPVIIGASVERGHVSDERLAVESSRMVVVGNALLLDPSTRLAVHQDFVASSLNWMMNRERLIGITAKRKMMFRLELTEKQRKRIFWVTALLMPGTTLMFGFLVWAHRRS